MQILFNNIFSFKITFSLFIASLLLFGCEAEKERDEYLIKIKVANFDGNWICLDQLFPDRVVALDSIQVEGKEEYEFRGAGNLESFYQVRFKGENGFPVFPGKDIIEVKVDFDKPDEHSITGNKITVLLRSFIQNRGLSFRNYGREKRLLKPISRDLKLEAWRQQEKLVDNGLIEYRDFLCNFIDTVSVPEMRAFAVFSMNMEANYYFLQGVQERLMAEIPNSPFVKSLNQQMENMGSSFMRWEAKDISGWDVNGKEVRLSETKGKMTLVYYWASYCEFSRTENIVLQELYEKYHSRGFEIFAYSIDNLPSEWQNSVQKNGLTWDFQLRGDKDWNSLALLENNIPSVPSTILIDHKGIIRSRNIRADELKRDMDKLLKAYAP